MKRILTNLAYSAFIVLIGISLAYGGATFSRIKTWSTGETLTAAQLNAEFNNFLNNLDPTGIDDESANDAAAQAVSDPYAGSSLVKATSLETEIQQLRYLIAQITGETYWYIDSDSNIAAIAANDWVTNARIVDDALDSEHYTDGSIDAAHLVADVIDEGKIADNGIDSEHYNDGSIDAAHLAADVIDETKIADDGIDSEHYNDGSIDAAHLAAAAKPFRGHLAGLGMSNDTDTEHDILVAVGEAADSAVTVNMVLSGAITKQIDATWAAGDDAGGMNDGDTVGNSEWFHVFLLSNATGSSVDAGFDTSLTAAGLLADTAVIAAGLTLYRRIGSVLTDGSANIIAFSQVGDEFLWKDPPLDIDDATPDTTANTGTISTPLGVKTRAILNAATDGGVNLLYISSLDVNDEAASHTAAPLAQFGGNATYLVDHAIVRTNTSSQIRYRCSVNVAIGICTLGWLDRRGRDS